MELSTGIQMSNSTATKGGFGGFASKETKKKVDKGAAKVTAGNDGNGLKKNDEKSMLLV